jgi:prepilin-type N-terminal cleavage/methylation domain-containing protein
MANTTKNGFTLLELMLASALFVTLLANVWGLTLLYLRTEMYAVHASQRTRVNRLVVRLFNDDLTASFDVIGSAQQLRFNTRISSPENVVTVIYELRQGLGLYGAGLLRQVSQTQETRIIPEVIDCRFRYFDGANWHDAWNSRTRNRLPAAIEFVYRIQPARDANAVWESIIAKSE